MDKTVSEDLNPINELNLNISLSIKEKDISDIFQYVIKVDSEISGEDQRESKLGNSCNISYHGDPFCFHIEIRFMLTLEIYKEIAKKNEEINKNLKKILDSEKKQRVRKMKQGILKSDELELQIFTKLIGPNFNFDMFKKNQEEEVFKKRIFLIEELLKKSNQTRIIPTVVKEKLGAKMKMIGGIKLPIDFSMQGDYYETIGKPILDSIGLSFKDSKIGIKRMILRSDEPFQRITLILNTFIGETLVEVIEKSELLTNKLLELVISGE